MNSLREMATKADLINSLGVDEIFLCFTTFLAQFLQHLLTIYRLPFQSAPPGAPMCAGLALQCAGPQSQANCGALSSRYSTNH